MYSPQYKKLIDTTIAPLSPCGKKYKSQGDYRSLWLAIPGGVPPFLINGIEIHSENSELVNNLEQIQKKFPNATIFDENQQVYGLQSTKEDTETKTDTKTTATNNMSQERVQ